MLPLPRAAAAVPLLPLPPLGVLLGEAPPLVPVPLEVPEPLPVLALGVPTAAGGAVTELTLCVLKVSRKTRAAVVLTIARMMRRMAGNAFRAVRTRRIRGGSAVLARARLAAPA